MPEQWREIPRWAGIYEASDKGRIRTSTPPTTASSISPGPRNPNIAGRQPDAATAETTHGADQQAGQATDGTDQRTGQTAMSTHYPDSWKLGLASREQREVIERAGGQCELRYAPGCTGRAVTTSATLPFDPISSHRACCQNCADRRDQARR